MAVRIAFVGFRHGHIFSMFRHAAERQDISIVAVCEEDAETRETLPAKGVAVTHTSYARMLAEVECDAVACGDYFGIRGERLIQALETGRHVIGDKPLCTSLEELARIKELAESRRLRVGCMLDLGASGPFLTLRDMIRRGCVGEVHTVVFLGQHPLLYGKRAPWYFEPGKHGGTINDIGIHAFDLIPWLTGRRIVEITAARGWNAKAKQHRHFQDGGSFMLRLDNDGCVLGDVSYLSSDRHGYGMPSYWRFTISGAGGVLETSCTESKVYLWDHESPEVIEEKAVEARPMTYLDHFLADLAGRSLQDGLDTTRVLESSRLALLAQRAADTGEYPVAV